MRIGLLPPWETCGDSLSVSAATPGMRPRSAAAAHVRLIETDVTQSAIYGGSHVDLDHQ